MSIHAGLNRLLVSDASIAAVITARCYPIQLPQNPTLPAVTYFAVSGDRLKSNSGPQDYGWTRFQIDTWALSMSAALSLADLILARLDGYKGSFDDGNSPAVSTWTIQGAFLAGERDFYESDPKQYRVSRDYMIWFVQN